MRKGGYVPRKSYGKADPGPAIDAGLKGAALSTQPVTTPTPAWSQPPAEQRQPSSLVAGKPAATQPATAGCCFNVFVKLLPLPSQEGKNAAAVAVVRSVEAHLFEAAIGPSLSELAAVTLPLLVVVADWSHV